MTAPSVPIASGFGDLTPVLPWPDEDSLVLLVPRFAQACRAWHDQRCRRMHVVVLARENKSFLLVGAGVFDP